MEDRIVAVAKALASSARVKILQTLERGERCGCELAPLLGLDPSVVSRHLAILSRAGLVTSRREGVRVLWQLSSPAVPQLLRCLAELACGK